MGCCEYMTSRGFQRYFSLPTFWAHLTAPVSLLSYSPPKKFAFPFHLHNPLYSLSKATPDAIGGKRGACTKASLNPLDRHISVFLQPNLNIISVPLDPSSLGTNSIQTSSQYLIKSFLTLVFKEPLDICDSFLGSERSNTDGDDKTEHGEGGREFLDESVPVLLCPGPKGFRTGGVGAETPHWMVDLDELVCGWRAWGMGYLRLVP